MRKKVTFVFAILVITLVLSGCATNIDMSDVQPIHYDIENESGSVGEYTFGVDLNLFPFRASAMFSREEGELFIKLRDPDGKILYSDILKNDFVYINYPEGSNLSPTEQANIEAVNSLPKEKRESWGIFNLECYPEQTGVYTLEISGESASGDVTIAESATTITDFTGKVAHAQYEVEEIDQMVRFIFSVSGDAKGKLYARVFNPNDEQIRVTELSANNPHFMYEAKAEMTGIYTAYIDAEDATCEVGSKSIAKKNIPYSIFIMPILIALLGVIAYFFIRRENRKLVIWGAIYWLGAYFIGGIIFSMTQNMWNGVFWGASSWISLTLISTLFIAILVGISPLLSGWVKDVKQCSPQHLIGFGAGFVIAPAILEGLNGVMDINGMLSRNLYPMSAELPGFYSTTESVILRVALPVIARIGLMVIVFALAMIIIWAYRQKSELKNRGLIILGSILGIVAVHVAFDYLLILAKDTVSMFQYAKAYSFGSPLSQGITITVILIAIGAYLFTKRSDLLPLAQKACEVTINDMRSEKHKEA